MVIVIEAGRREIIEVVVIDFKINLLFANFIGY